MKNTHCAAEKALTILEVAMPEHKKYLSEYRKMKKGIGDIFEHIKSKRNIQEIVNKKMGLCLFMDVVTLQPKYNKNKIVNIFITSAG